MSRYELMTSRVVDTIAGWKLMHFPADKGRYYTKDPYGAVSFFGKCRTNKEAKARWRGELRSKGVHV